MEHMRFAPAGVHALGAKDVVAARPQCRDAIGGELDLSHESRFAGARGATHQPTPAPAQRHQARDDAEMGEAGSRIGSQQPQNGSQESDFLYQMVTAVTQGKRGTGRVV